MKKLLFNFLFACFLLACAAANAVYGQEINCKVTIRHDKISNVDPSVFTSMEKAITDFVNTHKWTNDDYAAAEKIDCNIYINLMSNNVNGDVDAYSGTLSIEASRPVYNTTYTSPLINYIDKDVSFHYTQYSPLNFDDNQVAGTDPMSANLTAILAYYCYITLGLDYDSFSPEGGTTFLKKAQNIVNNAPDSKGVSGWKAVENTRNRYWIIDQMLNSRFNDVRAFWYTMHREGLDSMYAKPNEARTRILTNVKKLYNVNKENPNSIFLQFLFNAKSDEFIHLLAQTPKQERAPYISLLSSADATDAAKYNSYR